MSDAVVGAALSGLALLAIPSPALLAHYYPRQFLAAMPAFAALFIAFVAAVSGHMIGAQAMRAALSPLLAADMVPSPARSAADAAELPYWWLIVGAFAFMVYVGVLEWLVRERARERADKPDPR